jgi:hypothetical protein
VTAATSKPALITPEIISQITEYADMIDLVGWGTITVQIENHRVVFVVPAPSLLARKPGDGPPSVKVIFNG